MASEKVLILGAKGMLGQELARVFGEDDPPRFGEARKYEVAAWDREEIDVTDFVAAEKKIKEYASRIILNAVAYNAVDLCEESDEEYVKALLLNAEVPKFLARVAKEIGATFVHYSTDYVFDGKNMQGYTEDAEPSPISCYGVSKREGEKVVISIFSDLKNEIPRQARNDNNGSGYYIIRLSKLFGQPALSETGKKSFFEVMLEKAKGLAKGEEIKAVDDEKSCFTYAPDLAEATKVLIEDNAPYGIYHLPNSGGATWYEAAQELFRLAKMNTIVKPVSSDAFPRPARRPKYSVLFNTKRPILRPYTEALAEFLGG